MKYTALLLAGLAALWAHPAPAQSDFLTLEENVDASGTALMCPTHANDYVDCADVEPLPSVPGSALGLRAPRLSAHQGRDRHRHREASGHASHDRLYLRARGDRQHRKGKSERAGHSHSRGMWVE